MLRFAMSIGTESIAGPDTLAVENPATCEQVGLAPDCDADQLDAAVGAAREAWHAWRSEEARRRAALSACAEVLVGNVEPIAEVITAEQGKPLAQARDEVRFGASWFTYYSALPLPGEVIQDNVSARVEARRQSLGPVAAIVPWNFPVGSACMKIAPALLAGNTVVLKPSLSTPLSMLLVGELLRPVLPAGVLNVVSGGGGLGALMSGHPGVRKVTLTGSVEVGMSVAQSAAPDLKRVTLELGGNDPAFVLPGADPQATADALAAIAFRNCGQVCNAPKRIYAHDSLHDELVDALSEHVGRLRVGRPDDPATEVGPLCTRTQVERVAGLVEEARADGAVATVGGVLLEGPGHFYAPTVLTQTRAGMSVVDEEQFGPVLPVVAFTDLADAVAEANDTQFGLGASVWTADIELAKQAVELLDAGSVWVNTHGELHPHVPMAGIKWSGLGVEHGPWGLEEYLDFRVVWHAG